VAAVATRLTPAALLATLFDLEQRHGRVRLARNAARTLDLDLLLYDEIRQVSPTLTLPHPRLHLRAFVLVPLAEIAPDLQLPGRGRLAAWLPAVATQNISRLA
jgi:2-amino-4-hydroxy-6-hydroxymethyldihydropteridine diphosphokinase